MNISIRSSSLSGYADCARRAACGIIPDLLKDAGYRILPRSKAVAMSVGTAVHAGEGECMAEKIKSGKPCSESQTVDRAVTELDEECKDTDKDTFFDKTSPDKTTSEKQVIRMTQSYYQKVQPDLVPERIWDPRSGGDRLIADAGDGFKITGHPDVMGKGAVIHDMKTGSKLRPAHPQLGCYSLLCKSSKVDIKGVNVNFIQRVTIKKDQPDPVIAPYPLDICEQAAWDVINQVKSDILNFLKEPTYRAFMANPLSMLCSAKWCAAKTFCPFWKEPT